MKDRLVTAGGAALALLILYAMFFQQTEPPVTRPVTTETGRNGYAALVRWLESSGVPVASLRERFDRLVEREPGREPPFGRRGNVLITTMPHLLPVRAREDASLKAWILAGNTLLVLAALDDTPEWTPDSAALRFLRDLQVMTGLRFAPDGGGRAPAPSPIAAETELELEPLDGHPLMEGVAALHGFSDDPSALWSPAPRSADELLLRIAVERSSGLPAAWQRRFGNGHLIVLASGTLFTNHMIARSDAGRLFANLVRHHLGDGGTVIFDDMHQGLSVIYDAAAFFRDPRLHHSLWFLLAGWLVYLLGSSNRLAPPRPTAAAPRQRDFLEAVGGFMARRLEPRDAGRKLLEGWFDEVRRARGLTGDAPPWKELEATPTLSREILLRIRRSHEDLAEGNAVDLVRLHNTLRRAREAIG